jgi:hypothetical protein
MTDIPTIAISFNLYYGGLSVSEMLEEGGIDEVEDQVPVTEETPRFRDIHMKNITVKGAMQAVVLQGLPEMHLENVSLRNMLIEAENGMLISDASQVRIEEVELWTSEGNAMNIINSSEIRVDRLRYDFQTPKDIVISGKRSHGIHFRPGTGQDLAPHIYSGEEVATGTVSYDIPEAP